MVSHLPGTAWTTDARFVSTSKMRVCSTAGGVRVPIQGDELSAVAGTQAASPISNETSSASNNTGAASADTAPTSPPAKVSPSAELASDSEARAYSGSPDTGRPSSITSAIEFSWEIAFTLAPETPLRQAATICPSRALWTVLSSRRGTRSLKALK